MCDRRYISSIFEALAALSSIATLLSFMFTIKFALCCSIILLVFIALCSYAYAEYQNWPLKKIEIPINDDTILYIEEGDLFADGDIFLIPVNEYFDVHVGDGVVDPHSIHGLFINMVWQGDAEDLYNKHIISALKEVKGGPLETINRGQWYCHGDKYAMGTCVDVHRDGKIYVLFALTHFDNNNKAFVSRTEYHDVIIKLMDHVNCICERKKVCMPLFGTGLGRLQSTPMQVLHYLIDCIRFECSNMDILGGVRIKILSLDKMKIELRYIKEIFKKQ